MSRDPPYHHSLSGGASIVRARAVAARLKRLLGSMPGRNRELEAVGVLQPEYAGAPGHVGGLYLEFTAKLLDLFRNLVDVLVCRNLQREPFALDPVQPLGSVILTDQDPHVAGSQRNRPQPSVALVLPVDGEAHHLVIPRQAAFEIFHGQRGRETAGLKGLGLRARAGALRDS